MARPPLEVADVLNQHGDAFVARHRGHLSLGQLKVMSAIRACRTAALGGHVARCTDCDHTLVSYNSCRNRHCPKCQGAAARQWLADREADLLPVAYYHVVFTLPATVADIAFQNKAVVYDLLFRTAAETLTTIAADPRHLGARIGLTAVLHTWGSALTHHPHVHMIVPGGGLSPDGTRWIACRPGFFLPVRVLSRLFRRLFLDRLTALHEAGRLAFFGEQAGLADRAAFAAHLAPPSQSRMGRLCQAALRRPGGGARLSVALHPPGRDQQQPASRLRRGHRDLPLEGLSRQRQGCRVAQDHDGGGRRVHPPIPDPRPAQRIPPHPPLRPVCQRHPGRHMSPASAACSATCLGSRRSSGGRCRGTTAPIQPCPCCGGRMVVIESFGRGSTPRARPGLGIQGRHVMMRARDISPYSPGQSARPEPRGHTRHKARHHRRSDRTAVASVFEPPAVGSAERAKRPADRYQSVQSGRPLRPSFPIDRRCKAPEANQPAVSFPGGFRTPAVAIERHDDRRHPKPFTGVRPWSIAMKRTYRKSCGQSRRKGAHTTYQGMGQRRLPATLAKHRRDTSQSYGSA